MFDTKSVKSVSLTFKAGEGALRTVRKNGFDASLIGTIAGASGGAKWLVLSQIDRAIFRTVLPRLQKPVHLLGSSIGAWRFACYAQSDPHSALDRFETAYIEQSFSNKPDTAEITGKSREILAEILGENGISEILDHACFRTHVMVVRSRHLLGTENRWLLGLGLATAAGMNIISRRSLGLFFERALFHDDRDRPPFFNVDGFPMHRVALEASNFEDAVVASGSIPLVLESVKDIKGAPTGRYRDGGIIDYHHDVPHSVENRLTLYPHFYDHIVPGWFDKHLTWRRPKAEHVDRTILISPSAAFVDSLPNRKIPDRTDFVNFTAEERKAAWWSCVSACERLADEFSEVIEKDQLAARLEGL